MTQPPTAPEPVPVRLIGYWRPPDDYPDPRDFIDPTWDLEERDLVIDHLRHGTPFRHMMGLSPCRICGEDNGSGEQTDGVYAWPTGFLHYVEEHDVRPPPEFVEHVNELMIHYAPDTAWWEAARPAPIEHAAPATWHVSFIPPEGPTWNALITGREWVRLVRRNPDGTGRAGDLTFWRGQGFEGTVVEWLAAHQHHFESLEDFDVIWDWHTSDDHPHLMEPDAGPA